MLLHGVKDNEFEIFHGCSLKNDWDILNEENPSKKITFDGVVANPPFSLRWDPNDELSKDFRFKNYGLAPKSAADFAFLLHGFHYLNKEGTMAIILPHGVLFRGGSEAKIRKKLLVDGHIDTVIGLPSKLFFSTGIPVCIIVLKKCKKSDDVLFINASEHFKKEKKQNKLTNEDINKIVDTYQYRKEEDRYSKKVTLDKIKENEYNLNISRYISTAKPEKEIDLKEVNKNLKDIQKNIEKYTNEHNEFLKELGLDSIL
jgi:type I restriction enzyme M protein